MSLRYHEWLKHIFDHEVGEPSWYRPMNDSEVPFFEASPAELVALIGQTFRKSGTDLLAYSDSQVDQGFWYLVSASGSDYMFSLKADEVPIKERLEAIEGIYYLFCDCFAKRCTEALGHLGEKGSDLNSICYMFWDVCPITYLEDILEKTEMQNAIFNVLERSLTIKHRACREGALHGLGHMQLSAPERTRQIIGKLLNEVEPDAALQKYAMRAQEGNVL